MAKPSSGATSQIANLTIWIALQNLLPVIGLAWTRPNQVISEVNSIYTSAIYDDRRFTLFNQFIDIWQSAYPESAVYVYMPKSTFLKATAQSSLDKLYRHHVELVDPGLLFSPIPLKSAYLYPEASQKAISLYYSLISGAKIAKLAYVSCITATHTSVTDSNLISLGVFEAGDVSGHTDDNRGFSLRHFLARQVTMMGKRRYKHGFLRHPMIEPELIRYNQSMITRLIQDRMLSSMVTQRLSKLADLDKIIMRFVATAGAAPKSLSATSAIDYLNSAQRRRLLPLVISIYESLVSIRQLVGLFGDKFDELVADGRSLSGEIADCAPLINLINRIFDVEQVKSDGSKIINEALRTTYTELNNLYEQLTEVETSIEQETNRVNQKVGNKAKVIHQLPHGKVFRVPKTVNKLPDSAVLLRVNKSETIFTTTKLQEFNAAYNMAVEHCAAQEDYLIKRSLHVLLTYITPINSIIDQIAHLDILNGIANTLSLICNHNGAGESLWNVPVILQDEAPIIEFQQGRHPLLAIKYELANAAQKCIPNDFNAIQNKLHFVITGPNMGGKSTYSRQQALLALMSGYGMLVPCKFARITPIHTFWARIGASDNPCRSSSTFMVEAQETAEMLNAIDVSWDAIGDGKSLVILDELGRGTSVQDGLKFAQAIEIYLVQHTRVVSLCATHFHELGDLKGVQPLQMGRCFTNAMYHVREGVEKDSDGILTAEHCGFPLEILQNARAMTDLIHL